MSKTKTTSWIVLAGAVVALAIPVTPRSSPGAAPQGTNGYIDVRTSMASDSYQALKERAVMVSVIRDGAVLRQTEVLLNSSDRFQLAPGLYDVRVEGDGMQTLVKRGVQVTQGDSTNVLGGPMRAGVGAKVVEYAVGGLSREEVAARLAKLEGEMAELLKARPAK